MFDLPRLQKDIIRAYLAGKPQIEHSPEHVRIPFKFRAEASQTVSLGGADLDLSVISEYITPDSGFRVRSILICYCMNVHSIYTEVYRSRCVDFLSRSCLTENTLKLLSVNFTRLTTIDWLRW